MINNNSKIIISIFVFLMIIFFVLTGYNLHQVNSKNNIVQNNDLLYARKEELIAEGEKLQNMILELNQTLIYYENEQEILLEKLSTLKSATEIAEQKKLLAEQNKQIALDTTVPQLTKTTPVETVTVPKPITRAS